MNAEPPEGPLPSVASVWAYMPLAQLAANVDCALLTARSEPIADASLPEMRARSRPGTAIAAMMPMIATTIRSSIRVKPFWFRTFIANLLTEIDVPPPLSDGMEQRGCQPNRHDVKRISLVFVVVYTNYTSVVRDKKAPADNRCHRGVTKKRPGERVRCCTSSCNSGTSGSSCPGAPR